MRQTAINCTERTGKPKTTRNVIAAISAAGRWTPPAWCEDGAMGTADSKEINTIPEMGTHMVFVTDQIRQTESEIFRYAGLRIPKKTTTGNIFHQSFPEAE